MKFGVAAFAVAVLCAPSVVWASACGEKLHLTVDPPAKAAAVAVVLKNRLNAFGAVVAKVAPEGDGLTAVLPTGANDTLLTRPGKIEFRLIANASDAGALSLPRLDGGAAQSVSPEIILDETHLRQVRVVPGPGGASLAFHFDPHAMKNLMAASTEAIGRKLAILIDDRIVADPEIRAPIASAGGEIPAGPLASAAELAVALPSGRLPAKLTVAGREPAVCGE